MLQMANKVVEVQGVQSPYQPTCSKVMVHSQFKEVMLPLKIINQLEELAQVGGLKFSDSVVKINSFSTIQMIKIGKTKTI